ncbi:MAG: exosortase/archaeosortase family protein [Chloroflexi bacterium]|nr:exosortase/archaeosortase family protein [Chloroflexota bacterium]MBU1747133.1 exosortase/archaeosortase family protein [Chloroflexota bacterium]MBU1879272.1 exosortase/archaeosortase family protein [Chloroflexota bacterium]
MRIQWFAMLAVGLLVVVLYAPTLRWLTLAWLQDPYYSHGWLVVLVSAVLAWQMRARLRQGQPDNQGLLLLTVGVGVYSLGWLLNAPFVVACSLLPVLAGLVWTWRGAPAIRALAFPIAFLACAIPLPWIETMTWPLESLTMGWAAGLVQLLGIPVQVSGGQVTMSSCNLTVGAACSGMRSLIALLALSLLLAYWLQGRWAFRLGIFVAALPLALAANALRVAAILVAGHVGGSAAASTVHDLLGPVFFFVALGVLLLLGRLWGLRLR